MFAFTRRLAALVVLVAAPVLATESTSVVSVTPLPNHQIRVCWNAVHNASAYWIEGSSDVENVVVNDPGDTEELCRDVNLFGAAECTYGFVTVSVAMPPDDTTFSAASDQFYFLHGTSFASSSGDVSVDMLAAPPICSPPEKYTSIEGSTSLGPGDVSVRDVTRASDERPRIRIATTCSERLDRPAAALDHYEIYESTLKSDGSSSTRTTSRPGCPDGTELTGDWGDRSTVTIAAIFRDHDAMSHSFCSAPRVVTYGSSLLSAPVLRAVHGRSITGSAPKGTRDLVLVSRNGDRLEHVESVSADGSFSAEIPAKVGDGDRLFILAHRVVNGHDAYSEPAAIEASDDTPRELVLNDVASYVATPGVLFVSGMTKPFQRVHVKLSDATTALSETDLYSCANGTFGGDLALDDESAGEYTLQADAGTSSTSARIHLNEVYPEPRISLDQGGGPFAVSADRVLVSGRVTPVLKSSAPFSKDEGEDHGSPYQLTATVNDGESKEVTVDDSGAFIATISSLRRGTNKVTFVVTHKPTDVEATPVEISIERGRDAKGVDLDAANKALGTSLQDLASGADDKARRSSAEAISINPSSPRAYGVHAAASIRGGDQEAAYRDALRATELDPRSVEGLAYRTNLLVANSKWQDVIDFTSRALELDASLVHAWDNRALARLQIGRFDQAISDASNAISLLNSDGFARAVRAKAYLMKSDFGSALTDARQAVSLDPDDSVARVAYAIALNHFGQTSDAADQLRAITDAHPESEAVWNTRAWAEYKMGLYDKSIEDATRSIELQDNPYAHGTRAWSRAAKGETKSALEDLDRAAALEQGYEGEDLDRGLALYLRGDYAAAVNVWQEALAKFGDESDATRPMLREAIAKAKKTN